MSGGKTRGKDTTKAKASGKSARKPKEFKEPREPKARRKAAPVEAAGMQPGPIPAPPPGIESPGEATAPPASEAAGPDLIETLLAAQGDALQSLFGSFKTWPTPMDLVQQGSVPAAWTAMAGQLAAGLDGLRDQAMAVAPDIGLAADLGPWRDLVDGWYRTLPLPDDAERDRLVADSMQLWSGLLAQFTPGASAAPPELPRQDRRFADPRWREQPVFALIHQAYLLLVDQVTTLIERSEGLAPAQRDQLRFAARAMLDALSPANFPATNPVVLQRLIDTGGDSLLAGLRHAVADLRRGQLTQSAPGAFTVGENIATTPGKVIHETRLFQLIQYDPTTPAVLEAPLVIFPAWINRFYILDLTPAKSFVRWAVDQGLTVLMVSWKSADASLADVTWDDYVRAQIEAIDVARARFKVPAVHTIGYCVAGTTLAATLAVLARRGEAAKVASATFFTAQVDFELAGDLKHFIDDRQLALLNGLAKDGCIDGRYLASAFNLLRGQDLIWNYVVNNYLLGEDYRAFDLLHWNSDPTNVPACWHRDYLRDLYRDNLLVEPDRLSADGTPIDLRLIATPCYIQAGREDHIAPPESVWRLTRHLTAPYTFVLAGSGHIAGVVNPPAAGKYQYWTNPARVDTLDAFVAGAEEHRGSWWPHWIGWLRDLAPREVQARGRRKPGGRGDRVIEDAPGRYVRQP